MCAPPIGNVLEHKANISNMLLSYTTSQDTLNKHIIDVSSIEELMAMCSYIVGAYRNLGGQSTVSTTHEVNFYGF